MGYGDARASSLPLIVQRRTASRPPAPAATTATATRTTGTLAEVTRVWLDRRFRPLPSTPT